jgi:hypothetical protein
MINLRRIELPLSHTPLEVGIEVEDLVSQAKTQHAFPPPVVGINNAMFQQQMMAMMNLLTQSIVSSRETPAPPRPQEPRVKDPNTFHGQRDTLNAFITKCTLVFELHPSKFTLDQTKVNYMILLL